MSTTNQQTRQNNSFLLMTPNLCRTSTSPPKTPKTPTSQHRQGQAQISRQNQQVQQQTNEANSQKSDRLQSLHSRLHQEADKIRRWKVQTEIEQKQKERQLKDAEETIEHQRKAVVDLQV